MLALSGCERRPSVVQAQRQIHRALRAAVTIAETVVDDTTDQGSLAVTSYGSRIGSHGSEYHSMRGFSAPVL
jgi:hypothetical protein